MSLSGNEYPAASGVYAAIVTPRQPHSVEADTSPLFDYMDSVISAGVDGIVLFGSTGEFVHFDLEERIRVAGLALKRAAVPLVVNVSHSTIAGAIKLATHAANAGAAGVLLLPPYFYRYNDNQLASFYESFVHEVGSELRIYLYNLPQFTNSISPQLAERLLASGAYAGIKDSSGDWANFEALESLHRKHSFKLLVGHESLYLRSRLGGGHGTVSGIAAALPELVVAIERAIRNSDRDGAEKLSRYLEEFVDWVERFPATYAIRQAGLERGWKLGGVALPVDDATASNIDSFRKWFADWWPAVLAECAASSERKASKPK